MALCPVANCTSRLLRTPRRSHADGVRDCSDDYSDSDADADADTNANAEADSHCDAQTK